jgi:hypothetical protein
MPTSMLIGAIYMLLMDDIKEAVELRLDGDAGAIEELKAACLPGRVMA